MMSAEGGYSDSPTRNVDRMLEKRNEEKSMRIRLLNPRAKYELEWVPSLDPESRMEEYNSLVEELEPSSPFSTVKRIGDKNHDNYRNIITTCFKSWEGRVDELERAISIIQSTPKSHENHGKKSPESMVAESPQASPKDPSTSLVQITSFKDRVEKELQFARSHPECSVGPSIVEACKNVSLSDDQLFRAFSTPPWKERDGDARSMESREERRWLGRRQREEEEEEEMDDEETSDRGNESEDEESHFREEFGDGGDVEMEEEMMEREKGEESAPIQEITKEEPVLESGPNSLPEDPDELQKVFQKAYKVLVFEDGGFIRESIDCFFFLLLCGTGRLRGTGLVRRREILGVHWHDVPYDSKHTIHGRFHTSRDLQTRFQVLPIGKSDSSELGKHRDPGAISRRQALPGNCP